MKFTNEWSEGRSFPRRENRTMKKFKLNVALMFVLGGVLGVIGGTAARADADTGDPEGHPTKVCTGGGWTAVLVGNPGYFFEKEPVTLVLTGPAGTDGASSVQVFKGYGSEQPTRVDIWENYRFKDEKGHEFSARYRWSFKPKTRVLWFDQVEGSELNLPGLLGCGVQ
jgi:hypothetical protein